MHESKEGWLVPTIKIIGVGSVGLNAINSMIAANPVEVEFIAVDAYKKKIDKNLLNYLKGADIVFIATGMGEDTGTGADSVIGRFAKELGILVIGVATIQSPYEEKRQAVNTKDFVLKNNVDTLIVIPTDRPNMCDSEIMPVSELFAQANDFISQAILGISDILVKPGLICLKFEDLQSLFVGGGIAAMGVGVHIKNNALEATKKAINNSILKETLFKGPKGILMHISCGLNMSIDAIEQAAFFIEELLQPETNIIFILGVDIKPEMKDDVMVTLIATGFDESIFKR